jgi:hypothetical protein
MEDDFKASGTQLPNASLDQMLEMWNKQKQKQKLK